MSLKKARETFQKLVDEEVSRLNKVFDDEDTEYDWASHFPYNFSDCRTKVCVDGELYVILNYGEGDYGFGREFGLLLYNKLKEIGYYLENEGMGVFIFAEI